MTEKVASEATQPKPKGGRRTTTWKPGQSGNPKGGPKRGESWAEIITTVGNMTPMEVVNFLAGRGDLQTMYRNMPQNIPLKQLVTIRIYAALMFEPTPGLINAFMDRTDGKVKDMLDITSAGDKLGPTVIIFRDADENDNAATAAPQTG